MLQSNEVREIMSHATSSEKRAIMFFGALYGLWCALTLAPCTLLAMSLCVGRPWELNACIASILLLVHVACVPLCLRVQRLMLAGTSWARANGIMATEISLFRFSRCASEKKVPGTETISVPTPFHPSTAAPAATEK